MIVDEAGVTVGALYYYFADKQSLYGAAAAEVGAMIIERLEQAAAGATTFGAGLAAALDAAVALHGEDPSLAALVSMMPIEAGRHPELIDELSGVSLGIYAIFRSMAERAVEAGEIDLDVDHVATMSMGLMMGFSLLAKLVPSREMYEGAAAAGRALIEGELSPPARPARRGRR